MVKTGKRSQNGLHEKKKNPTNPSKDAFLVAESMSSKDGGQLRQSVCNFTFWAVIIMLQNPENHSVCRYILVEIDNTMINTGRLKFVVGGFANFKGHVAKSSRMPIVQLRHAENSLTSVHTIRAKQKNDKMFYSELSKRQKYSQLLSFLSGLCIIRHAEYNVGINIPMLNNVEFDSQVFQIAKGKFIHVFRSRYRYYSLAYIHILPHIIRHVVLYCIHHNQICTQCENNSAVNSLAFFKIKKSEIPQFCFSTQKLIFKSCYFSLITRFL